MKFIGQTIFYFLIIMALVYLYSYAGINNSGFIYNEF
ncbi:MAG: teichoic acid D-Ala incorporation-associated protein DltX [Lactobacillus sp.]|uniref:Teichoic acid D-Ala incorporation-associated protein DltX n=1 Tax=Bombilactobacillus bombi TaxID=1303590 RepID=A0A347SU91_9LACO|nr:teichoic acid D-Ala incorporation-associated protein DltX [Bombilactobacillus bombi]MCO6541438.1 teichoic acid D-Ala incorporation-associated protein DltX [Lactobacillus sp.]MCO6543578.1 teichoic acid D-Ala incorporation-associated protein DltX [Lactobacillus sp.]RHW44202.1 teichoic acid D-Ala incorporation-associated protein DltX [Bombilactobacillus bombi]RHW52392.1 teichoic acid D-Ala incorporation-associated protein DltX [Bombilactobacillus bombi]